MGTENTVVLTTSDVIFTPEILNELGYLQIGAGSGALEYVEFIDDLIMETLFAEADDPLERIRFVTVLSRIKRSMKILGNL